MLMTSIGSKPDKMEVLAFLKEKKDVSKNQHHDIYYRANLEPEKTVFSLGSIFTLECIDTWTIHV